MVNYGYIYKALYVEVYKGLIGKIRRSFFFLFFRRLVKHTTRTNHLICFVEILSL